MGVLVFRRRAASDQPKGKYGKVEAAAAVGGDGTVAELEDRSRSGMSFPTAGADGFHSDDVLDADIEANYRAGAQQEMLRPVMSSDRDALEAELEMLRRQLSSTAVGAG